MLRLTADTAAFAAERRGVVERADKEFEPLVRSGLARYDSDKQWYSAVRDAALALWDSTAQQEYPDPSPVVDDARKAFADLLVSTLTQTTEPADPPTDGQVDLIVFWLSTFTINSATWAAAMAEGDEATLEWVSMRDEDVRPAHREAHGQVIPVGGTFEVDGYELHHPGEPVGPPQVWIRCRCMVRPGIRGEFSMGDTITAAASDTEVVAEVADTDDTVDPGDLDDIPPAAWDDLDFEVPWHGVLAPVNVMSGDGRKLSENARFRDLPLPIKWMPAEFEGHTGSVVVANIDRAWIEDGFIKGEGTFLADDPNSSKVIDMVANRMLRGFSVDLDEMVTELQNEDGTPFDMDDEANFTPDAPTPVMYVTDYRIASATVCPIPAFQEAYIALGPWADEVAEETDAPEVDESLTASSGCPPCQATALMEAAGAPAEHIERLLSGIESGTIKDWSNVQFDAPDGTKYAFENGSLQVFAPGTRDGPGWVTNPDDTQRLRNYWVKGKGAAKIRWGAPGDFNRCRRQLAKYIPNPNYLAGTCANLHKEAIKIWPGEHRGSHTITAAVGEPAPSFSLVASAGSIPVEWFGDPHLTEVTPITVTDDGRVFGHVATWNSCHVGKQYAGMCVTPPRSRNNYANFHQGGTVLTTEGALRIGHLTYGIGHAEDKWSVRRVLSHYDNALSKIAQVRAGEDDIGIWVAGVCKPGITEEEKYNLRASALSGDWRNVDGSGHLEMIATLCVNVPGFPMVATTLVASAGQTEALIASNIVTQRKPVEEGEFDVRQVVRETLAAMKAEEQRLARLATIKRALRAERLAAAKASLQ